MERYGDYSLGDAVVKGVESGSIAADLGLQPGDRIVTLNGQALYDVFDFREREMESYLLLSVLSASGEAVDYEIEKDADEELGIIFENPLLVACEHCANRCIFCFIDQLPRGLRSSLYFKDDDSRLSFLTGNYVTLTNMSETELQRIIHYRFSPLNISVHSTDPRLRVRLMANKKAAELLPRLQRIVASGIHINCQFVLCPGLNDGAALDHSLRDLEELGEGVESIALVPVGITRFRQENHLYPLRNYTADEARALLAQVRGWQEHFLARQGRRLLYAADEFYLLAGETVPEEFSYEGYPQLENGVGMARALWTAVKDYELAPQGSGPDTMPPADLEASFSRAPLRSGQKAIGRLTIASGVLGRQVLEAVGEKLRAILQLPLRIVAIPNQLFGETITVTGLLSGRDIAAALQGQMADDEALLICDGMLRQDEDLFLDDWHLPDLAAALSRSLFVCGESGDSLCRALAAIHNLAAAPQAAASAL